MNLHQLYKNNWTESSLREKGKRIKGRRWQLQREVTILTLVKKNQTQNNSNKTNQPGKQNKQKTPSIIQVKKPQNTDSDICSFQPMLKGRGKKKTTTLKKTYSESSLVAEIFLECFSCLRVFFFLVRHVLFELLPVIYALYLGLHYPKRVWLERGLIPLLMFLCPTSSAITPRRTQIHQYLTWRLSSYLPFFLCNSLKEFSSSLLEWCQHLDWQLATKFIHLKLLKGYFQ